MATANESESENAFALLLFNELFDDSEIDILFDNDNESSCTNDAIVKILEKSERKSFYRNPLYWESSVPRFQDVSFEKHFRMPRSAMEKLCTILSTSPRFTKMNRGGTYTFQQHWLLIISAASKLFIFYSLLAFNSNTLCCSNRFSRK